MGDAMLAQMLARRAKNSGAAAQKSDAAPAPACPKLDPQMHAACEAAMRDHRASTTPGAHRTCTANSLSRFWSGEDPWAAEKTDALVLRGALSPGDIETLLAIGEGLDGQRTSGRSTLCDALATVAHDIAYSDEHVALYLHRDALFQQTQPALLSKLIATMRSQLGEWGDPEEDLAVRCIELHAYAVGGGLITPEHRDNGSKLTISFLLSHTDDFAGGQFVT